MPHIAKNPAAWVNTGRAPKCSHCVEAWGVSEDKPDLIEIQELRAAWLAQRYRISAPLAAAAAFLAFEGGAR